MKVSKHLAGILHNSNFIKKGHAFFRIQGDGVVQVIKYEYERNGDVPFILSVGLMSMYDSLLPQWFTSSGCIPRYEVANIIGIKETPPTIDQEELLLQGGLQWLNSLVTQKDLIEGIGHLDMIYGRAYWLDDLKIAPFLAVGDTASAGLILTQILQQHQSATESRQRYLSVQEYESYCLHKQKEDRPLVNLLSMIQSGDNHLIQMYLIENYRKNCAIAYEKLRWSNKTKNS